MWVGHNPRCMRIFAITSRCSMKARILIAPPQRGQMSEDLRDDLALFDEGENSHCSATARTDQRVHLVDVLDEASTSSAEHRA